MSTRLVYAHADDLLGRLAPPRRGARQVRVGPTRRLRGVLGHVSRRAHLRPAREARGPDRAALAEVKKIFFITDVTGQFGVAGTVGAQEDPAAPTGGLALQGCELHQMVQVPPLTAGTLAIGTNRGQVYIYDHATGTKTQVASKHKRRILCGDWNLEDKFAFGSEDRQITICLPSGRTFDQVKIKASPQSVTFGGKTEDKDAILSVNMGGKTILLYDLNERENALELAFQARYGNIVSYQWFGNGYIIAGFSSGYVVIISTHLNEIGQEQYCAKFHEHSLREIVYNEANGTVATCGDNCIKVVRMSDWKEIAVEYLDSEPTAPASTTSAGSTTTTSGTGGTPPTSSSSMLADLSGPSSSGSGSMQAPSLCFEDLKWTPDGRILSVSSHNGCLHNFMILSSALRSSLFDLDSPFAAVLKPIAPWTMLFTMGFMVIAVLLVISVQFQVSCMDVIRAMTGFVEAAQIKLKGESTPAHALALNEYTNSTPWWRIIAFAFSTPLPCLMTVSLSHPSDGMGPHTKNLLRPPSSRIRCGACSRGTYQRAHTDALTFEESARCQSVYAIHMMAVLYVSLMLFACAVIVWYPKFVKTGVCSVDAILFVMDSPSSDSRSSTALLSGDAWHREQRILIGIAGAQIGFLTHTPTKPVKIRFGKPPACQNSTSGRVARITFVRPAMGVSQALINAWDFVQVELKGEYSPGRVLALNQYSTSTPWWRIIVLIILTPLPSLIYICLPETVDLAPPYRGMAHNKTFFGRFFLSYTMWCLLQMHMISERMPLLKLTKKQLVISAVTVAVLSTGFELLYAWWIGFPVPYTIHMMAVPYVSLMFFAFAIMWYPHVRQNWGLLWKIADAVLICVCHGLVIIGYPLFYFFFLKMHGIESSAFSLVLPVLKTLYRVMFYYFCRSASGERITIVVVFNADMVNALFVNFCMQYQPSFTTTFTLMLANALQVVLVVRDIDDIRKKIAATAREIVDVRNNDKYSSKLPGERVATFKMLPRAADIFQRYTFDTGKRGPKPPQRFTAAQPSDVTKQIRQCKGIVPAEITNFRTGPRASAIIEPISELEVLVPAAPAGPRTTSMVETLSELEQFERKYASLVRKLMYASEFSILTAYAEVITPIVYYAQEATRLFDAAPARVRAGQVHDSRPDGNHLVGVLHDADFTRTLQCVAMRFSRFGTTFNVSSCSDTSVARITFGHERHGLMPITLEMILFLRENAAYWDAKTVDEAMH
ncbi:hypothetical protein ON010_g9203 [Phytophthora cinnamomi]|nr:hypothetical protein ON010_g9203 [Phytophthora cinnamomi]